MSSAWHQGAGTGKSPRPQKTGLILLADLHPIKYAYCESNVAHLQVYSFCWFHLSLEVFNHLIHGSLHLLALTFNKENNLVWYMRTLKYSQDIDKVTVILAVYCNIQYWN